MVSVFARVQFNELTKKLPQLVTAITLALVANFISTEAHATESACANAEFFNENDAVKKLLDDAFVNRKGSSNRAIDDFAKKLIGEIAEKGNGDDYAAEECASALAEVAKKCWKKYSNARKKEQRTQQAEAERVANERAKRVAETEHRRVQEEEQKRAVQLQEKLKAEEADRQAALAKKRKEDTARRQAELTAQKRAQAAVQSAPCRIVVAALKHALFDLGEIGPPNSWWLCCEQEEQENV